MNEADEHRWGLGPVEADRDPVAVALRRALRAEAAQVAPSPDGLRRIRSEIAAGADRQPSRWLPVLAAAATAGLLITGGGLWLAGNDREPSTPAGVPTSTSAPATSPSSTATSSPSPSTASGSTAGTAPALPVYYPAEQGSVFALFREFHATSATAAAERVELAVEQALSREPDDPDYALVWPVGSAAQTSLAADSISIDLNSTAAGASLGSEAAVTAVQQLVWTATAAAGRDVPVQITVDGEPADLFGVISLQQPQRRQTGEADPRGLVWITSLAEGARLRAGQVRVTGEAVNSFENTVDWSLQRGGDVVDEGFFGATLPGGGAPDLGQRGQWSLDLDLAPGEYTLTIEIPDASGGAATRHWSDSKRFTVK